MNDLAKLNITKDSFIYSINQAYEARLQHDGNFKSHLRYEPFLEKSWSLPKSPDVNSFKKSLEEIIQHHYATLPNYRREESVNIENISWFSHSMAALFADIEYLLTAYTGHGFPMLSDARIPRSNTSKSIIAAIKKYADFKNNETNGEKFSLFPLHNEENSTIDETYTHEVWSLIFYFIKKSFGVYTELIGLYALWKYVTKLDSSEVVDWNVRPPCGELYRKQFKHLFEKDYQKSSFKKNGSESNHFKKHEPESNGELNETNRNHKNQSEKVSTESPQVKAERPERREGGHLDRKERFTRRDDERNERKERFTHREGGQSRFKKENNRNQEAVIEKALEEVNLAIKKLQKNSDLQEIELAPQNSFIRRQQHVVISEAGFETESRGEGDARCVCIKRK